MISHYRLGDEATSLRKVTFPNLHALNDGTWHRVRLLRSLANIEIVVDDEDASKYYFHCSDSEVKVEMDKFLGIGADFRDFDPIANTSLTDSCKFSNLSQPWSIFCCFCCDMQLASKTFEYPITIFHWSTVAMTFLLEK